MSDPLPTRLARSFQFLVPGSTVHRKKIALASLQSISDKPTGIGEREIGQVVSSSRAEFWYTPSPRLRQLLTVQREHGRLTKFERQVLRNFAVAMDGLLATGKNPHDGHAVVAGGLAFEHLLVARYVKGASGRNVWRRIMLLAVLQELTTQRYEGTPCTSGFVAVTEAASYIKHGAPVGWTYDQFDQPLELLSDFFDNPAASRYVDGRNQFYLTDNLGLVRGVLRCNRPQQYSLAERVANKHLSALFASQDSRVWVASVGRNDDVNVVVSNTGQLRWIKGHWHIVDRTRLMEPVLSLGLPQLEAELLVDAILLASDLRRGALVLILEDVALRPQQAGHIDASSLAQDLLGCVRGRLISELSGSQSILGLLTADGLTTIAKSGSVVDAGEIIQLTVEGRSTPGGGRTHAAASASMFGLAIKVSADGPVTVYRSGTPIVRFAF